jgi:hypothetical protein
MEDKLEGPLNEEHKREKGQRYAGLTTAAIADAGERTVPLDLALTPIANSVAAGVTDEQATPLFSADQAKEFRVRWDTIQAGFVDEPRRAVEQADSLVAGGDEAPGGNISG